VRGRGSSRPRPGRGSAGRSWSNSTQTDAPPQQQQQQQQRQPPSNQQQQQQQQRQRFQTQEQQQQQQPQLLFQGSSAGQGSAAPDPGKTLSGLLIAKISKSNDLQELAQVLQQHKTALGPVHISAAISRVARLHPGLLALRQPPLWQQQQQQSTQQQQQQQQLQSLLSLLLPLFGSQLQEASLVEVSCLVGGLARMGCYNAPSDVIDACLDVTRHGLGEEGVSNKELLQLGWGLARMGRKPDDGWLAAFEAETRNR
jgi:hypothetical protein